MNANNRSAKTEMTEVNEQPFAVDEPQQNEQVDDKGTTQAEAAVLLRNLRDRGFDSSNERLALALGRSAAQIESWCNGVGTIDDDVVIKARGLAETRKVSIAETF